MHIESVRLRGFRNFDDEEMSFAPRFNLLIGANAQGKTNIIEAVALLATGHSFRSAEFRDMIRWGGGEAFVSAKAAGPQGTSALAVRLDHEAKRFMRDDKRTLAGFANLAVVLFAPEEIGLFKGGPSTRRKAFDSFISQVAPAYRGLARRFERVVSHRNRLLREAAEGKSRAGVELDAWSDQLAALGVEVIARREGWCRKLNDIIPGRYARIAPADGKATLSYLPCCGRDALEGGEAAIRQAILDEMSKRRGEELLRGLSLVGPHRDDFEAQIAGISAKGFASQGQHRTFILALKMAQGDLMRETLGEAPILLLDDVASELDERRNRHLFEYLSEAEGQAFITATDADAIQLNGACETQVFQVSSGRVRPQGPACTASNNRGQAKGSDGDPDHTVV